MRIATLLCTLTLTACAAGAALAGVLVNDNFAAKSLAGRDLSPTRGDWRLDANIATCTQDDALYTKNKNHGPIMWYDVNFTDGVVKFAIKPQGAKQFVFTLNNDKGHVFRFITNQAGTSVRCWPEPGPKATAKALLPPGDSTPTLADGEWIEAEVAFNGDKCVVKIGDFEKTFENPAITQPKTRLGLGFAFGTLSIRDVSVVTP